MNYGLLLEDSSTNLDDDIKAYAAARFYPHLDFTATPHTLPLLFQSKSEPDGMLLSGWRCEKPVKAPAWLSIKPVGFSWPGNLMGAQAFHAAAFLRRYAPVGCADVATMRRLQRHKIPCYFSGSLLLTLPRLPKTRERGGYACLVDVSKQAAQKARAQLQRRGLSVFCVTHRLSQNDKPLALQERFARVEQTLRLYQNARIVVTGRLPAALCCLALGTPVLALVPWSLHADVGEWAPYRGWLSPFTEEEFLNGDVCLHTPASEQSAGACQMVRKALIEDIAGFIKRLANG